MQVAVAAGKGGTGKTTVAVSLALAAADAGRRVRLLDCDVEAPNAHLLLSPAFETREEVHLPVPRIDAARCTGCGRCADLCAYGAILCTGKKAFVFEDMCHGCGGCRRVCPQGAVSETSRVVGTFEEGMAGEIAFAHGRLRVGEPMAPPLIRRVKASAGDGELVLCDAPPGTSCPVLSAATGCDAIVLIAEPTPFGMNDLALAARMARPLNIPVGIVINRGDAEVGTLRSWCAERRLPVLACIEEDRRIAEAYSRGVPAVRAMPELEEVFAELLSGIESLAYEGEPA